MRIVVLTLLVAASLLLQGGGRLAAQESDLTMQAQALLDSLSVEERVGQLFLVTFAGTGTDPDSDVAELIVDYDVGGVVILSENDNVLGQDETLSQVAATTNGLQRLALFGSAGETSEGEPPAESEDEPRILPTTIPVPTRPISPTGLPLLIATVHEGNGAPNTELLQGVTGLPSQMAIGATWQPEQARLVGEIVGSELSALGINMLLGPSLDVLENPAPFSQSDLGTRIFGGDPYWVGLMGQAYTAGVHAGSAGRIAVIAKHFPGYGSSDRPINFEVGTVRKSLEQLKQIELAPFFVLAATSGAPLGSADGLLTAHVRYQGFQGNIRATTAPVSFDPQALSTLMQLPEFSEWREQGGVIVSDALGVRAVQRFYDSSLQEFPHRLVAKDALLAGNDLLFLSEFALEGSDFATQVANIKDTIDWFRERYVTDPTFQQRIDDAALRILRLKLKLYGGNLDTDNVYVDELRLADHVGNAQSTVFDLAQNAITLIAPSPAELIEQLPPKFGDSIIIFTDVREQRQCSSCPVQLLPDTTALERRIIGLYGPGGSEQVQPSRIQSFTFDDLKEFLLVGPVAAPTPTPAPTATPGEGTSAPTPDPATLTPQPTPTQLPAIRVQAALQQANWVIFALLDQDPDSPAADALSLFLSSRPDIVDRANVVVFAYDAPYFLDTTEISKLTAYFGVYSRVGEFIDASVRALFLESPLRGRPPVSIDAVGYDLFEVTKPDPEQVIELFIVDEGIPKSPPSQEPLEVVPGATLRLQTGVVVDHNGFPVPDGTPIRFVQQDRIQGFVNVIAERPTVGGVTNLDYLLDARSGNFRITTVAGEATASQEVNIVIGENAIVSVNTPTPAPTPTSTPSPRPSATPTATATTTPTPTLTPLPTSTSVAAAPPPEPSVQILLSEVQMLMAVGLGLLLTGGAGLVIGRDGRQDGTEILKGILWGLAGSLFAYNYLALELPGADSFLAIGPWGGLVVSLMGGVVGLVAYRLLLRR